MRKQLEPISEVTQRAHAALVREIGVVNTIRFLNQFRSGSGDYTLERRESLQDQSIDELLEAVKSYEGANPR